MSYVNGTSSLLTQDELSIFQNLLGSRCQALAVAVVRVYSVGPTSYWIYKACGVAGFIRDKNMRAYFIRVYDVIWRQLLLEQELYLEMEYTRPHSQFHIMQSDSGPLGLSFASSMEGNNFGNLVVRRLQKCRAQSQKPSPNVSITVPQPFIQSGISDLNKPKMPDFGTKFLRKQPNKNKKQKFTSRDISNPSNFRHIDHVGYNKAEGKFDIPFQASETMRQILRVIGQEDAMEQPQIRQFVYEYTMEHGGLEEYQREAEMKLAVNKDPTIRVPVPPAPRRPTGGAQHPPPPPPPMPPVAPKPMAPPPPVFPTPPALLHSDTNVPVPPPPPILNRGGDPADQTSSLPAIPTDIQSQIMSFQKGNLRKVAPGTEVSERPPTSRPQNATTAGGGDLLQSLAHALEMRRNQMCDSDSEQESVGASEPTDFGSEDDWES